MNRVEAEVCDVCQHVLDHIENWHHPACPRQYGSGSPADLIASQAAEIERLTKGQNYLADQLEETLDDLSRADARAETAERERDDALRQLAEETGALTPSAETKAAYMGEFSFSHEQWNLEGDDTETVQISVPWTTIKEIMAAILARTTLSNIRGHNG